MLGRVTGLHTHIYSGRHHGVALHYHLRYAISLGSAVRVARE